MAERNQCLAGWMARHQMTAGELADAVNDAIGQFAGRRGRIGERTVFRWLSGENRWPQERQRRALERVTGLPAAALGFAPRTRKESDVRRRRFVGVVAAGTTAAAFPLPAAPASAAGPPRVGTSDVIRLREVLDGLAARDAAHGGHGLEHAALARAAEALDLQQQSATQRVRQRLFGLAAAFTATAAWSRIDAGQLDGAGRHLDRALMLAGLAQDSERELQVWNLRAMLARQGGGYSEAVAASRAAGATAVARRSPLHASLAHARTAVGLARAGETRAALACLGRAEDALGKSDPAQPRAAWIAFYGPAELYSLTAIVRDLVGYPAQAEAASHRALAALPPAYRRNRALITARLALAQLHQGDIEHACATSERVFTTMAGTPLPGRLRQTLGDFQRELIARAPARIAAEWSDRHRIEWSRP
ncbi:XRE family transcriptional regulator [Streptomyces albus]|uniref:XRE family transcriptional regulator n=1 Tax=Streptomyces albus TaxID=1888 RepID=UPI003406E51E